MPSSPRKPCRRCGRSLTDQNARRSRGHFVGACRACESDEGHVRGGFKTFYPIGGKGRRKYPIPEAVQA